MKTLISTIIVILFPIYLSSQNIKDYYIPTKYNEVHYLIPKYMFNPDTQITNYKKIALDNYEIRNIIIDDEGNRYIKTNLVNITNNEVNVFKSYVSNDSTLFNPTKKIIVMPPFSKLASWSYYDDGELIQAETKWVTEIVNNISQKVLQKTSSDLGCKTIEYYVKGLGLWRSEMYCNPNGEGKDLLLFHEAGYKSGL